MPITPKITLSDYYDCMPDRLHRTGDIWSGMPSLGFPGARSIRGIIITPACDLSNHKTETLTYLPIISVREYFSTLSFLPELIGYIRGQIPASGLCKDLVTSSKFLPPENSHLEDLSQHVEHALTDNQHKLGTKERTALERIRAGVHLLQNFCNPELLSVPVDKMELLMGKKELDALIRDIVTNAYSTDMHFLPSDAQPEEWSGVLEPSVVLFRYPCSIPVSILDAAQEIKNSNWNSVIAYFATLCPGIHEIKENRPMKKLSLRPRFTSDLITRYISMYIRLGAPNMSSGMIDNMANQVKK